MAGLIHLYCGDGKGKTTAAIGLAVRAAGAGQSVLFAQFFKNGSSSEITVLQQVPQICTMHCRTVPGLFRRMTEEQKQQATRDYTAFLEDVLEAAQGVQLLVLDEAVSACNRGVIPEERLAAFLRSKPERLEVVLTGRDPSQTLQDAADYMTEMRKQKHPFDQGVKARKGIEF